MTTYFKIFINIVIYVYLINVFEKIFVLQHITALLSLVKMPSARNSFIFTKSLRLVIHLFLPKKAFVLIHSFALR